ncbi:gas vesicle protein GvpO [Actinophytocola sp.]|uniref:gas vesicle protein GvpO n=1 Tax=Actinophytocola sp. TaxID=1872138 RepID=UPI002ED1286B
MATAKSRDDADPEPADDDREMSASSAGAAALEQVRELIGRDLLGITSVEPIDDGWVVEVEVVEDRRVPSSSDMLATYAIELDLEGALMAYRRTRRYARGRDPGNGGG